MSPKKKSHVLCVDDEPLMLRGLNRCLRGSFKVVAANSSEEALEHLRQRGPFAVIVSDFRMPGMDGVDLLTRVKEIAPDTVRVLLSGRSSVETAAAAVNRGEIFRFLVKPCPEDILVATLRDAEAQYQENIQNQQSREEIESQLQEALLRAEELDRLKKKLEAVNLMLYETSITDPLTGLLNRRGFDSRLWEEITRTRRYGGNACAVLIDCDNLKLINTHYGHAAGDKALQHISKSIAENTRTSDVVARIGGDEFLLLLPETTKIRGYVVAEKIRHKTSESPVFTACGNVVVTISAGVSAIPPNANSMEDILYLLKDALHSSKDGGRDRVVSSKQPDSKPSTAKRVAYDTQLELMENTGNNRGNIVSEH